MTLLAEPVERFEAEHCEFLMREQRGPLDFSAETERLTKLYGEAGQWLLGIEIEGEIDDHARACFVREVLEHGVAGFERCAQKLWRTPPTRESLASQYAALAARFRVNVSSFERKLYANLPHTANKAMNLNAYLALLGGSFRETQREDGLHLEPARLLRVQMRTRSFVVFHSSWNMVDEDHLRWKRSLIANLSSHEVGILDYSQETISDSDVITPGCDLHPNGRLNGKLAGWLSVDLADHLEAEDRHR